jgi:iron complex outermembrane receptor protein
MRNRMIGRLLAGTFICGSLGIAAPAYAQDEDQDQASTTGPVEGSDVDTAQGEDERIVVTGSRIPQPNLSATSPVTVVNSQEVRLTGTTRAEDLINSLPQAFAAQGGNIANAATGTATLNLRGLGSVRTLVLINGRRLMPGDPFSPAADINAIPAAIIDRVDVLTGGASSVYGADAVAGVVNFVMDTDFEGVRLDGQYSFYNHQNDTNDEVIGALNRAGGGVGFGFPTGDVTDGGAFDITLAMGVGFDDGRGHITAYAGYRDIQAVLQAKRDYSACNLTAPNNGNPLVNCGGSGTSAVGTFLTNVGVFQVDQAPGTRRLIPGQTLYNFGPLNHFQRPDERYVAGVFAEYEISGALQPYMEFMFMDDRTTAQIAPSGDFFSTTFINCGAPGAPTTLTPGQGNPLLSAQQRGLLCQTPNLVGFVAPTADDPGTPEDETDPGSPATVFIDPSTGLPYTRGVLYLARRNVEGGGRQDTLQHTSFRVVAGMRGDLSDVWSYDAYYQFGRVNFARTYLNDFSVTRLARAIDIIDNPATPEVDPTCRSVLDGTDPNCVAWDVFAPGQVSAGSLNYLQTPGFQRGFTEQTIANASLTGNLGEWGVQLPWAATGIGLALGVEYRKERLDLQTDIAFQTNDLAGQGAPTLPVSGDYDVREAFAEARIPIVEESFIHELSLELGYRYSDYGVQDRHFSTDTYKVAGFFAPVRDIRFRGGYNRAVRAPAIQELFAPQRVALNGTIDPCAGAVPDATLAQCANSGVTPAQYGNIPENPANQYNGLIGGNPNLDPEISDTWTAGVVIQPRFIPRLAITVDFFDISIQDAIQPIGQDTILTQCLETGVEQFCDLINRDARGSLWLTNQGFVVDTTQNIGSFSTRGVDLGVSYAMDLGSAGSLGFNFVGTWLDELIVDSGVPDVVFDCVGLYGNQCGTPTPEWRHTARLSWNHPDGYGASLRWRHFAAVDQDTSSDQDALSGPTQPFHIRLPAQNYLDLALNFRIGDHYNFRLGVNNLLDRDPPLTATQACPAGPCNGNTWAQVYDALGRYVFAGVTLDF